LGCRVPLSVVFPEAGRGGFSSAHALGRGKFAVTNHRMRCVTLRKPWNASRVPVAARFTTPRDRREKSPLFFTIRSPTRRAVLGLPRRKLRWHCIFLQWRCNSVQPANGRIDFMRWSRSGDCRYDSGANRETSSHSAGWSIPGDAVRKIPCVKCESRRCLDPTSPNETRSWQPTG